MHYTVNINQRDIFIGKFSDYNINRNLFRQKIVIVLVD